MYTHWAIVLALPIKLYSCLSFSSNKHFIQTEEGDCAGSVSRTEKLEEEKKLLRVELNRCVEKVHFFFFLRCCTNGF